MGNNYNKYCRGFVYAKPFNLPNNGQRMYPCMYMYKKAFWSIKYESHIFMIKEPFIYKTAPLFSVSILDTWFAHCSQYSLGSETIKKQYTCVFTFQKGWNVILLKFLFSLPNYKGILGLLTIKCIKQWRLQYKYVLIIKGMQRPFRKDMPQLTVHFNKWRLFYLGMLYHVYT